MITSFKAHLKKMRVSNSTPVQYSIFDIDGNEINMNQFIDKTLTLKFEGQINCSVCGRITKKAFGGGSCYPCFVNAPENAECIIRPELCLAHEGKGRDSEWEEKNHNIEHTVYLALTSGVKVGVTRGGNEFTRWIDQGAWKTIKLADVPNRYTAGLVEVALKEHISDKTNWQRMLKNERKEDVDLLEEKEELIGLLPEELQYFISDDDEVHEITYPVANYPLKVKSMNFDKTPIVGGVLKGIRGQYLYFDEGQVINLRKFTGYNIEVSVGEPVETAEQQTLF